MNVSCQNLLKTRPLSVTGTGRLKRPHRGSEQSQALLDESSESDSGVDEKQVGKFSEDETKANSADDFVVSVDAGTGAVRYESGSIKKSATDLASLHSRSLSDKNSSHSSSKSLSSWKPLPVHYFHSIVFDCTGWTFMDTMGIDLMKQVNCNLLHRCSSSYLCLETADFESICHLPTCLPHTVEDWGVHTNPFVGERQVGKL